jgi:hypothetical protein
MTQTAVRVSLCKNCRLRGAGFRSTLLISAGISHRRKTFPKSSLLSFNFLLPIQIDRLFLSTRAGICTTCQKNNAGRRKKDEYSKLFHRKDSATAKGLLFGLFLRCQPQIVALESFQALDNFVQCQLVF